jgi:hypothetical protein
MFPSYNFRINYIKGSSNLRADALSRRPDYITDHSPHRDGPVFDPDVFSAEGSVVMCAITDPVTDPNHNTNNVGAASTVASLPESDLLSRIRVCAPDQFMVTILKNVDNHPHFEFRDSLLLPK